jgi:hypothetical protein
MIQDLALACCVLYIGATAHARPVVVFKENVTVIDNAATA